MPRYQIANLRLDSAIPLPGVPPARRGRGGWTFTVDPAGPLRRRDWDQHERLPGGRLPWRSLARDGQRHVIRFWRQATFVVDFSARRIVCRPCRGVPRDTVRQLLVGQVMPLLFARRALALHASAVHTADGVVAFVGRTRRGKTTLASALGARGCELVADDCAVVEVRDGVPRVRPLDVGLRVWSDTRRMLAGPGAARRDGKTRVAAAALGLTVRGRPAPLARVYLLMPAASREARVLPVPRAEALLTLLGASFHLGLKEPEQLRRSFEMASALVARVPVRGLACPRGLRHVPAVVDAVLGDAVA